MCYSMCERGWFAAAQMGACRFAAATALNYTFESKINAFVEVCAFSHALCAHWGRRGRGWHE